MVPSDANKRGQLRGCQYQVRSGDRKCWLYHSAVLVRYLALSLRELGQCVRLARLLTAEEENHVTAALVQRGYQLGWVRS